MARVWLFFSFGFFFRESHDLELPEAGSYATGILFLDKDNGRREKSQKLFETAAADLGLKVLAWREIPKNPNCLGQMAQNSEPYLTQVLFTFSYWQVVTFKSSIKPKYDIFLSETI